MPSNTLRFVVDRSYYYPGGLVCGTVVAEIVNTKKARSIFVDVLGEAEVTFHKVRYHYNAWRDEDRSEIVRYSSSATYFNSRIRVWSPPPGLEVITPGTYNCPFQFRIPLQVPPSFEGMNNMYLYRIYIHMF